MKYLLHILAIGLFLFSACQQNDTTSEFEANFINPPSTAKPRTWVHAMSGNTSKAGFTKDLEAIEKVGIGGFEDRQVHYSHSCDLHVVIKISIDAEKEIYTMMQTTCDVTAS